MLPAEVEVTHFYGTGTGVLGGPVFFFYNRYTKYSKYPTYLPNAHEINLV
jgi:hypothetical protein